MPEAGLVYTTNSGVLQTGWVCWKRGLLAGWELNKTRIPELRCVRRALTPDVNANLQYKSVSQWPKR